MKVETTGAATWRLWDSDWSDTVFELHKKEPKKFELQKKEPSKLELHKLEPITKMNFMVYGSGHDRKN